MRANFDEGYFQRGHWDLILRNQIWGIIDEGHFRSGLRDSLWDLIRVSRFNSPFIVDLISRHLGPTFLTVLVSFRVRLVCPLSSVSQQGAVVTFGQVGQLLLLTSLTDGRGSGGAADCFYPSDFWSVSATATRLLPRLSHSSASPMTRHSPFRFLHLPTFSPCIDAEV